MCAGLAEGVENRKRCALSTCNEATSQQSPGQWAGRGGGGGNKPRHRDPQDRGSSPTSCKSPLKPARLQPMDAMGSAIRTACDPTFSL